MKRIILTAFGLTGLLVGNAQENNQDTTRFNMGEMEVILVKKTPVMDGTEVADTIDASPDEEEEPANEGHWGGIDFGATMLLNSANKTSFPADPQWENDPAKSFYWNINIYDHRFNIAKHYVGITTGFGVNFTQVGIKDDHLLMSNADSIWVVKDTVNHYSKNKLRGTYLQIPLLLEFNTNEDEDKSFYFATGVIGGVRVGSAVIQKIDRDNYDNKEKIKGTYGLNPFKLDATVRMGYGNWGVFANYALMPLFDTNLTSEVLPFTFGATLNF